MPAKLSKLMPEFGEGMARLSLLQISELLSWFTRNKPDIMKEAMAVNGKKQCEDAIRDLNRACQLWR